MSPLVAVRPEGADHQWRRIPPGELSIDPVADERLGRVLWKFDINANPSMDGSFEYGNALNIYMLYPIGRHRRRLAIFACACACRSVRLHITTKP
jgi:hypothetical protein